MNDPRPAYLEAHSALNWPLLTYCFVAPAAAEAACLVLGLALGQPWFFVVMAGLLVPCMIAVGLLYRNWPTGIRLDEGGISIGAVRSGRARGRRPTVNHQSWGRYACPWSAVQGVRVVTDQDELRHLREVPEFFTLTNRWGNKRGMRACNIGVLTSPFMRAALVVEVNSSAVTGTAVRPARFYTNYKDGDFSHQVHAQPSATWVVPTRRPEALRAAVQAAPDAQQRVTRR